MFIMIGRGWRIYNDDALFSWLYFPDLLVIGNGLNTARNCASSNVDFDHQRISLSELWALHGRLRKKLFSISLSDAVIERGSHRSARLTSEHPDKDLT